ncbi:hypothetical protein CR513_35093, partial [Mucuna pruriens]
MDLEEGVSSYPESTTIPLPINAHIELRDKANNRIFKVNGHQIKPFHEGRNWNPGPSQLRPKASQATELTLSSPAEFVLSIWIHLDNKIDSALANSARGCKLDLGHPKGLRRPVLDALPWMHLLA